MHSGLKTFKTEEKNASIKNNYYSIHTFELKIPLYIDSFSNYKLLLEGCCTQNRRREGWRNRYYYSRRKNPDKTAHASCFTCYDNEKLFSCGISDICIVEQRLTGGGYYRNEKTVSAGIEFQVNPRILLGYTENKYISIVPGGEIKNIIPMLVKTLTPYGFSETDLRMAVLNRMDLCANIDLENQASAEQYLKLLRKGGVYMGLKFKEMPVDPVSHRRKHPPNEVRYVNGPVFGTPAREVLSIYLKYCQMQEKSGRYDPGELQLAKGQVRFELRIYTKKLPYLAGKYDCRISNELLNMAGAMGADIFTRYLEGLYGTGKFVSSSRAIELIEQTRHHRAVKDLMIEIVNQTRRSDMAGAFCKLTSVKRCQFRKYFNELGISPVSFPDSWKRESFENPVTYIMTKNVNSR